MKKVMVWFLLGVFLLSQVMAEEPPGIGSIGSGCDPSIFPTCGGASGNPVPVHAPPPVINDNEKPVAQIIVPTYGQVVTGEFVVRAKATDNIEVQKVEFLLDGVAVFTDTIPTTDYVYQWLWDSTKTTDGAHEIVVKPYDTAGNFNELARVSVTVNNGGQQVQQPVQPTTYPTAPLPAAPSAPAIPNDVPVQQPIPQIETPPVQQQVVPVQPPIQQQPIETQGAPARGAVPIVQTDKVTEEKPLWLTLLMTFGLIVIAGGLLAFAFVKMRASPAVPESIKTYVSMSMQRGYPVNSIQRALQSQGWDDKVINEAFKQTIGK